MNNSKFHLFIKRCVEFKARDDKAAKDRKKNAELEIVCDSQASEEEFQGEEENQVEEESDEDENLAKKKKGEKRKSEIVVEGAVKKGKYLFLTPNPPPSSPTRPTTAQINARVVEGLKNLSKRL